MITPSGHPSLGDIPTFALYSESDLVGPSDLRDWQPALQDHVDQVVAPAWHDHGRVSVATAAPVAAAGLVPCVYRDALDAPGALGYHTDDHGNPIIYVGTQQSPFFTTTHEIAETLRDPTGMATYRAPSPDPADAGAPVEYLLEICDQVEAEDLAVVVSGVRCSNIILHEWAHGTRGPWDAGRALTGPRQVASGGYVSYVKDGQWRQLTNFPGQGVQVTTLGPADAARKEGKSLREWVNEHTREPDGS